eukprot:COSAG01_NODE_34271_length_550_cov_1.270510_1_plen_120_part_01
MRVLELATVVAAPSACAILADLGADVLKVERPSAPDYTRRWALRDDPALSADPAHLAGPPSEHGAGVGSGFTQFNRGKRALALDWGSAPGLRILKLLLQRTDVLVTNVRLRGLKNAGLDY